MFFQPQSSVKIAAEIQTETRRADEAEAEQATLVTARERVLLDDDTKELDKIEARSEALDKAVKRHRDRVALLQQRLEQVQDKEHSDALDALTAQASKARDIGQRLIRNDYAKAARAVAATMEKLYAIENLVEDINRTLQANGREALPGPNQIRCRPRQVWEETERRTVGLGQPEHPFYGRATRLHQGDRAVVNGTSETVPVFMDIDVPVTRITPAHSPEPLQNTLVLPCPDDTGLDLWNGCHSHPAQPIEKILSDLGL